MLAVDTDSRQARAAAEEPDTLDLLLWHEREVGRLLSAIDEHEQMLAVELRPALDARRHEIAGAERRLASIREQHALAARFEAITNSWSWRVTAPARRLAGWLIGAKGDRA